MSTSNKFELLNTLTNDELEGNGKTFPRKITVTTLLALEIN